MRQKVRKAILIIFLLIFPILIFYFSPFLFVSGFAKGIIAGSVIVFLGLFIISLFVGRIFCGWGCGAGGLQEACFIISKTKIKSSWRKKIKYVITISMIAAGIILLFTKAKSFNGIDFFFRTKHGISVHKPFHYGILLAVYFATLLIVFLRGKRAFCHYICWISPFMILGTKIKNTLKIPSLHLKVDKNKCVNCKLCDKNCPMSLEVNSMVQSGSMLNVDCILCGECVDVCKKDVIKYKFGIPK